MNKFSFPNNFLWGTATASYQIEGGWNLDGKGESIWDRFSHTPGKVKNGDTGDTACDHFHLYPQDIKLLKEIGVNSYRLSIAWPRIFPDGYGKPNKKGLDFYKNIIKLLNDSGIKPAVTLYHWDLPQKLQDRGGWANRETAEHFREFAEFMFKELGDQVPYWITLNEPWVSAFLGYWMGIYAPGITDFSTALLASHNLLLAHGKAVKAYRSLGLKGQIGITLNLTAYYPASSSKEDAETAKRGDGFLNRWFTDPVLKGFYPADMVKWYSKRVVMPEIQKGDMELISTPIDFLGINNYSSSFSKADPGQWPLEGRNVSTGREVTAMDWEIVPEGFYDLLVRLHKDYNGIKLIITENGSAWGDIVNRNGKVEDDNRADYLYRHLEQAHRAIKAGVYLAGYYVWSFMDNFEWAEGYEKRFGLVYVDYKTKKRIMKKSALCYRDIIKNNGFS